MKKLSDIDPVHRFHKITKEKNNYVRSMGLMSIQKIDPIRQFWSLVLELIFINGDINLINKILVKIRKDFKKHLQV